MKALSTIMLLMISLCSLAQTPQPTTIGVEGEMNLRMLGTGMLTRSFDNRYKGIVGHPFLYDSWHSGRLVLNGVEFDNLELKYDIYADEVVVKRPSGDSLIVNTNTVGKFELEATSGKIHRFRFLVDVMQQDAKSDIGFFEILHDGKLSLLKKVKKVLVKADYKGAYSAGASYDEFKLAPLTYYVLGVDKSLSRIKPKKRDVVQVLANEEIKAFIDDMKLKFKKEDDLVAVIEFYNKVSSAK